MEGRRRSVTSKYEFCEKRTTGKMKAPLAMVLSFNDKDVHPDCPNISNPYHKCGRHCLDKIPIGRKYLDAIRSGWDQEREKNKGVNPNCPFASNPYHKCDQYCLEKSRQDAEKDQPKKPKGATKKTIKDKVHLNRSASDLNKLTVYVFKDIPKKEHLKGDMKSKKENEINLTTQRELSSLCKNASKPYHVCDEYCFQSVPERERYGQVIKLKSSKEREKVMSNIESTAAKSKEESEIIETVEQIVNLEYKNALYASVVSSEICFESVSEREQHEQTVKPKEESKIVVVAEQGMKLEGRSASNSDYVTTENGFQSIPEREQHRPNKTEGVSFKFEKSSPLPDNKHILNPYDEVIEDRFDNPEQEHPNGVVKPKEERIVVTTERGVDILCKYSSNHYHESLTKSMEKEAVIPLEIVNPLCKRASNPYHVCAEYCFQNVSNSHHPVQPIKKLKEEDTAVLSSERRVNPECKFASNPYHACAEYCFQNVVEGQEQGQVLKQKSLKELKNFVSNKKIASGNPHCEYSSNPYHQCAEYCFNKNVPGGRLLDRVMKTNERKKENRQALRRDDNPKYKNASKSFNRCSDYSPEETSPKSEAVEGGTATMNKKIRNSSNGNKRNHLIAEKKSSLNSKYMEASMPGQNYVESPERIILQDGTEKRSSIYETKDMQSDIKNPKEATDVPSLHIDASDLFHEWAKYCLQTSVVEEDEIVKKQENRVRIGEISSTRNGKGNGDSENTMEKVEATGGFSRSFSILLLLILLAGFLLALLQWARLIDSLLSICIFREAGGSS